MAANFDYCKKPSGFFKVIELVIGIVTIGLATHYDFLMPGHSHVSDIGRSYLCLFTTGGFLLLSFVIVVGYSLDNTLGRATNQELTGNLLGTILNIAAGACVLESVFHGELNSDVDRAALAYGLLTLLNGVIYAVDSFFTYKQRSS